MMNASLKFIGLGVLCAAFTGYFLSDIMAPFPIHHDFALIILFAPIGYFSGKMSRH